MYVYTGLSTRFASAQNAHRVGLLITIAGERVRERPAITGEPADPTGAAAGDTEGVAGLAARNVALELRLTHPAVAGVMFYQRFPMEATAPRAYVLRVGDLDAATPQQLGLSLFVEDLDQLGPQHVADLRVSADVVVGDGMEHRIITVAIIANLDGTDHVDPTVERTIVRFQAARARDDAIQQADAGNFDGAANTLRVARDSLSTYARQAEIAEEMADLAAESMRLSLRESRAPPRSDESPDAS